MHQKNHRAVHSYRGIKCKSVECDKQARCIGFCDKHYQQIPEIRERKLLRAKEMQKTEKRKTQKRDANRRYLQKHKAGYAILRRYAKKLNAELLITIEEYEILKTNSCSLCSKSLTTVEQGLLRKDRKSHFTKDNVTIICKICRARNRVEDFDPVAHSKAYIRRGWKRAPMPLLVEYKAQVGRGKYQCAKCPSIVKRKQYDIDHIEPVQPVDQPQIDVNTFVERLYCPAENLQLLCKPCHKEKTKAENILRHKYVKENKK